MSDARIAVVGDYRADHETHPATTTALTEAGAKAEWVGTEEYRGLDGYDGVLIAPGSPYRRPESAYEAIHEARTNGIPLLGTCAGFQHIVIEYARNVLGVRDAQHGEYDANAAHLFVTGLACSLVGQVMDVALSAGTRAASAYGRLATTERYYCQFGLNPETRPMLVEAGLVVSGVDQDGEARVIEIPTHPFFIGTLFVPQVTPGHPLVAAFVAAAG